MSKSPLDSRKTANSRKASTRLVTEGRGPENSVVNPPVYRASTHLYENCEALANGVKANADGAFFYGRRGSPTQWALAEALTALEKGAFGTVLYPSGVAALAGAMLAVLKPGDDILISDNAYDPTRSMAMGLLKQLGIGHQFFDPLDLDGFAEHFTPETKAVLLECPGSLTMEVCDIPALAAAARDHGAISLLDNTWASSLGFQGLSHGCDIVIQALTKHVVGHSDVMMGACTAGQRWYRRLRIRSQQLGQVVSPDDAALALRGLRTMEVRLEKSSASALKIARWLAANDAIAHVLCPMLEGSHGYDLWQRDFTGSCGLFSFVLRGGDADLRARLVDGLELFGIGYSWGGFESLALPFDVNPVRSIMGWPKSDWSSNDKFGIRLSIGLEDADDLIQDLDQALIAMGSQ
jgi:cystathionine beta-lyase